MLFLVALTVVSRWFAVSSNAAAQRIASEREQGQDLLRHLEELYATADPSASPGTAAAARQLLDSAVGRLRADPPRDQATHATLLFSAGRVYGRLGLTDDARPLLEHALELRREFLDDPSEGLAECLYQLASCAGHDGDFDTGVEYLREALAMERGLHGDDDLHVAQVRYQLGMALHNSGAHAESQAEFEEAVRVYGLHDLEATSEHADALLALGDFLAVRGGLGDAIALYEEAHRMALELFGEEHPTMARALSGLGMLYYNTERVPEGIEYLREAVRVNRVVYGPEGHRELAMMLQNCGGVLASEGDPEGIAMLREAADMYRHVSANGTQLGFCITLLGNAYRDHARFDEAREAYEEALAVYDEYEVEATFRVGTRLSLARMLLEQGPSERAVELFSAVLEAYAALPDDSPRVVALREELEEALQR